MAPPARGGTRPRHREGGTLVRSNLILFAYMQNRRYTCTRPVHACTRKLEDACVQETSAPHAPSWLHPPRSQTPETHARACRKASPSVYRLQGLSRDPATTSSTTRTRTGYEPVLQRDSCSSCERVIYTNQCTCTHLHQVLHQRADRHAAATPSSTLHHQGLHQHGFHHHLVHKMNTSVLR